jgi:hypothetical protein
MSLARHFASPLVLATSLLLGACSSKDDPAPPGDAGSDASSALPWSRDAIPKLPQDDVLRVHHLQALGTHNSTHIETMGNTLADWDYTLAPLDVQLGEQGVRQIELDLHLASLESDFEVFHIKTLDEQTTCKTLRACLSTIGTWSGEHPGHQPIYVQFEAKNGYTPEDPEGYFNKLEAEILAVIARERIITPDEVQGEHASLGEAVTKEGWPLLATTRGRILFGLDDGGAPKDAYSRGGTSLKGRLIFTDADPGSPLAALTVLNDPVGDAKAIGAALAANMLVRTMADSPTQADTAAQAGLDAALAVGATWLSTNFPAKVEGRSYVATIPGGSPSRCNPVTAPKSCTAKDVEDLGR